MPLALLITLLIIIFGTIGALFGRHWLPLLGSAEGSSFDHQLHLTFVWIGLAFVFVQLALALFVWRYRASRVPAVSERVNDNRAFEITATIFVGIVFFALAFTGGALSSAHAHAAAPEALQVEVTGVQFQWYFRYPGVDGRFGATNLKLVDAAGGNPLGLDAADPVAKDDVVAAQLVLPRGRPVEFTLRAQDVIHSFYIAEMRTQMNAVPGKTTYASFTPTKLGTYELQCAQLCGLGHYRMKAAVRVVTPDQFEAWLAEQERRKAAEQ